MSVALGSVLFLVGLELLLLVRNGGSNLGQLSLAERLMVPYQCLSLALIGLATFIIIDIPLVPQISSKVCGTQ